MASSNVMKNRNEKDWELIILRRQAQQLKRESQHLSSKAMERPLTLWEKIRCDELLDELFKVFNDLAAASYKVKGIQSLM